MTKHLPWRDAYKLFWKEGLNFQGRARRKEFWVPLFLNYLIELFFVIVLGGLAVLGLTMSNDTYTHPLIIAFPILYFGMILADLALFLPALSIKIRRMHDIGKSGWYILFYYAGPFLTMMISIIIGAFAASSLGQFGPVLNEDEMPPAMFIAMLIRLFITLLIMLFFLYLFCKDSVRGPNKWGPDRKYDHPIQDHQFK